VHFDVARSSHRPFRRHPRSNDVLMDTFTLTYLHVYRYPGTSPTNVVSKSWIRRKWKFLKIMFGHLPNTAVPNKMENGM
jgi:hypothetical protein